VAATATYGVALLERAFEVFETAIGEVGRAVGEAHRDEPMVEQHRENRNEARA
jgi:hypothetical protein